MSRFYGSIEGQARTLATPRGSKDISAHIRGWDVGVYVEGFVFDGEDKFNVYLTAGSNGGRADTLICTVCLEDGQPVFIMPGGKK